MIHITGNIFIEEDAIVVSFVRAGGPGGQNVNKLATAALLKFDSVGLPEEVRQRLKGIAGRRMTKEGVIVIQARRFRTQEENRADALERLRELIREASIRPKARRKTRPTTSSKEKRLESKHQRTRLKSMRRKVRGED